MRWALLLALASTTYAQVVQWDIQRGQSSRNLRKRDETTWEEAITNDKSYGGYYVSAKIGDQDMGMLLDTGSSDTWVPYFGTEVCEGIPSMCDMGSCMLPSS